jgi:MFS family permease
MGSNQNKVWILLLIGAIVTIVAVLTPATTGDPVLYQWLWALRIWNDGEVDFNRFTIAIVGAVLETAVLAVAIVLMLLLALKLKKGSTVKGMYGIMLACFIMLVAAPVGYIIGAAVGYGEDYWIENFALFGIYGPFIAAGLLIVSFLFLKKK